MNHTTNKAVVNLTIQNDKDIFFTVHTNKQMSFQSAPVRRLSFFYSEIFAEDFYSVTQ